MPEGGRGWIGTTHTPWFGVKVSNDALPCPPSRNHLRGRTLDVFQPAFYLSRYDLRALEYRWAGSPRSSRYGTRDLPASGNPGKWSTYHAAPLSIVAHRYLP